MEVEGIHMIAPWIMVAPMIFLESRSTPSRIGIAANSVLFLAWFLKVTLLEGTNNKLKRFHFRMPYMYLYAILHLLSAVAGFTN